MRELVGCRSFLDLGCGQTSPITRIKHRHNVYGVGLDVHLPSLLGSKRYGNFQDYVLADVRKLPFKDDSFETVVALDVIEHLSKIDGQRLITDMERIGRKKTIIFTPNGYNPKKHLEDGNPYQVHKSGWTVDELLSLGYVVFGINSIRAFRGERATIIVRPLLFGDIISTLSDKLVYHFPSLAFQLLCIKYGSRSSQAY